MQAGSSLLQRAERLRVLARAAVEGSVEIQARERAEKALADLATEVTALANSLATAEAAAGHGFSGTVDLQQLTRGARTLDQYVRTVGRPSADKIRGALQSLRNDRSRLDGALGDWWRDWATQRLGEVPYDRIALLQEPERGQRQETITRLRADAGRVPSRGTIITFHNSIQLLIDRLNEIGPEEALDSALRRLTTSRQTTLADLTDDELKALRSQRQVASQIVLRLS